MFELTSYSTRALICWHCHVSLHPKDNHTWWWGEKKKKDVTVTVFQHDTDDLKLNLRLENWLHSKLLQLYSHIATTPQLYLSQSSCASTPFLTEQLRHNSISHRVTELQLRFCDRGSVVLGFHRSVCRCVFWVLVPFARYVCHLR